MLRNIKKYSKFVFLFAGAAIVLGLVIAFIGYAIQGFKPLMLSGNGTIKEANMVDKVLDGKDVGELRFNLKSSGLEIKTGNLDNIQVNYSDQMTCEVRDGVLILEEEKGGFKWYAPISLPGIHSKVKATLVVPESFKGDINVDVDAGDVDLENLKNIDKLNIKSSAGNIKLKNLTVAEESEIIESFGDLKVEDCEFKKSVVLNNDAGKVTADRTKIGGDLTAENSFGDIIIDKVEVFGNVSAKLSSGNIKVDDLKAENGEVNVKNEFGECRIVNSSLKNLSASVSSGSVKIEGTKVKELLAAKTEFGDVRLDGVSGPKILAFSSSGSIRAKIDGKKSDYAINHKISSWNDIDIEEIKTGNDGVLMYGTDFGSSNIDFLK